MEMIYADDIKPNLYKYGPARLLADQRYKCQLCKDGSVDEKTALMAHLEENKVLNKHFAV